MPFRYWKNCFKPIARSSGAFLCFLLISEPMLGRSIRSGLRTDESEAKVEEAAEAPKPDPVVSVLLGLKKPNFSKLDFYSKFYGQPKWQPTLGVNKYYFDFSALKLGLGFTLNLYNTSGTQQKLAEGKEQATATESDYTPVSGAPLKLALLSYAISLEARLGVPGFRYLNLDLQAGYQELYFEEVRVIEQDSSDTTTDAAKPFVNRGWNSGLVMGAGLNILLNSLDEGAGKSLNRSLGFSNIYLSPFIRVAQKLSNKLPAGRMSKKADFTSGNAVGIAFVFESL